MIPLDLFGEVQTSSGARYKLDANQDPGSRPQNFSFRTKIGEGFSDAGFQLARRIDRDYLDLNLVDTITFTGADGSVAYEGRVSSLPRDLSDQHSVGVTLAGWMAHAKDRKFAMPFTDRPVGQWATAPLERQAAILVSLVSLGDFSFTADQGGLVCAFPNQALGTQTAAEAWYTAPATSLISAVGYNGTVNNLPAGYTVRLLAGDSRDGSGSDVYTPTLDGTLRAITLTTARRYVYWQVYSNATAATPASGANVRFSKLGVYGNHGVTLRSGDLVEPGGTWVSDTLKYIAQRWCPALDTSGVLENPYVVQQLTFDRAFPYDAFLELNKYALWHLGVWENKRLDFRPYDLTDYNWEIRTDDPGTSFSPQGPSTEDLFNGIAVTYTNPLTGASETVTPEDTSTLADTSQTNPWNAWGVSKWDEISLSSATFPDQAVQLGRAALADRNRAKTPGTVTARGYIRDRAGNLQPCWKVRAGDTISITNFPNDSPRLIVETDYNSEDKSIRLSIDKPFALLDAYLDRLGNALGT